MSSHHTGRSNDLNATLVALDAATQRFVNGDPGPFKDLWSHSHDVTIAGGLGGIEQGWDAVGRRLDRVSAGYRPARFTAHRLAIHRDGDIACVVQREHFDFEPETGGSETVREYRATMVLRREDGAWVVAHRHADGFVDDRSRQ